MTKYTVKYIFFILLINAGIGLLSFLFSQTPDNIINNKDNIIVFIEAGYNVSDGWRYKAEKAYEKVQQKHRNASIIVYYFNQTYEIIGENIKGEKDFSSVSAYGDIDYSLLKKFEQSTNKNIDYVIGTNELKKHKSNSRFINLE